MKLIEKLGAEVLNLSVMLTKTEVLRVIKLLPNEFSIDEIVDKLILIEKIKIGLAQSERGEVISDEDVEKEINKWFI